MCVCLVRVCMHARECVFRGGESIEKRLKIHFFEGVNEGVQHQYEVISK